MMTVHPTFTLARSMTTAAKKKIRAASPVAMRTPPREFQLWNLGKNPTDFGVHVWNARSVTEVMARYEARGNPILLDVEHVGTIAKDGEPAPTAGYARLEIRAGVPWLVFDWSAYGQQQINTGERRFLSPEYDVDKNTGEILALYRVSLVADPGTHRARMLASAPRFATPVRHRAASPTLATGEQIASLAGLGAPAELVAWAATVDIKIVAALIAQLGGDTKPTDEEEDDTDPATVASLHHFETSRRRRQALSARELAKCKARGVTPAKYAAAKAAMTRGV